MPAPGSSMETSTNPGQRDGRGAATRRDRSIRAAILTSFLSKGGTALLQLVSIPVAVRVLGRAEFGLYTSVNLVLSTVLLFQIGIGPALAHGLAKAGDDTAARRRLATTSTGLALLLALAAMGALAAILLTIPYPVLLGWQYAGKEAMLRPALWLGTVMLGLLLLLNLTDRLREGCLETHANNIWGAVGNVLAAAAVGFGVLKFPYVWFLVLAIYGSQIVAKSCNTLTLWRRHPDLLPRPRDWHGPTARHLFGDGLAFSVYSLLTGLVEFNLAGWLCGRAGGPNLASLFGVFVNVSVLQLGFVMMVSTPTWPAVAEAMARGDSGWARAATRKLVLFALAFGLAAFAGWTLLGPRIFPLWLGPDFADVERPVFAAFGFYFFAHTWRHAHHMLMIGTGQVRKLARIQLAESLVLAALLYPALHFGGVTAMFCVLGGGILLITGTQLPRWVRQALRPGKSGD